MNDLFSTENETALRQATVITSADINILVACEESQAVTKELRALGH